MPRGLGKCRISFPLLFYLRSQKTLYVSAPPLCSLRISPLLLKHPQNAHPPLLSSRFAHSLYAPFSRSGILV